MSFRFMRMMLFFDLPRDTAKQRGAATRFVKDLLKQGLIKLQQSVYCKLSLYASSLELQKEAVKKIKPQEGNIMLLTVTEKQFNSMEMLLGTIETKQLSDVERVVFI